MKKRPCPVKSFSPLLDTHFRSAALKTAYVDSDLADKVHEVLNALATHGMVGPDVVYVQTVQDRELGFTRFEPIARHGVGSSVRIVRHANPPSFLAVHRRYVENE